MTKESQLLEILKTSEQIRLDDADLLVSNTQESDESGWHDVFIFRTQDCELYECRIDRYGGATYHVPNKLKAKRLNDDFEAAIGDNLADQHDKTRLWPKADNE
jgi:hypothetical protein